MIALPPGVFCGAWQPGLGNRASGCEYLECFLYGEQTRDTKMPFLRIASNTVFAPP